MDGEKHGVIPEEKLNLTMLVLEYPKSESLPNLMSRGLHPLARELHTGANFLPALVRITPAYAGITAKIPLKIAVLYLQNSKISLVFAD